MPPFAPVTVRFLARRAVRTAANRAARRAVEIRTERDRLEAVEIDVPGFRESFPVPEQFDSPGDLPL